MSDDDGFKKFFEKRIEEYAAKLSSEKDSLIAKYLAETGAKPSELCIVEKRTQTGQIFFIDLLSNYQSPE